MIRFMFLAVVVIVAVLIVPEALKPGVNSADLMLAAAPLVALWIGWPIGRRRGSTVERIRNDHPDARGSLDCREDKHREREHHPPAA